MVRLADKMGIMLWEEISLWQGIAFRDLCLIQKNNPALEAGFIVVNNKVKERS